MKKSFPARSIIVATLFICLFLGNCKKPERIIKVATLDIQSQDITYDTIIIKGEIIDIGDGILNDHGILLRKSDQAGDNFPTDLSLGSSGSEGLFSVKFVNPLPDTEYEYKAYAGNSGGTVYGKTKVFTTPALTLPELTTDVVTEITTNSARSGGNITNNGGADITARGICWSTTENPTTEDSKTDDPNPGPGEFVNHLAWLTANTEYYVRAYATNSVGTAYGNQVAFTTLDITQPVLTTAEVSEITNTDATSGGNITGDGGSEITSRGICWSTEENPTTDDEKSVDPVPGTGEFVSHLSVLNPGTIYYVRAYASNAAGTGYGNQVAFKTLNDQHNYSTAGDGLTDIDGNIYASVIIGGQEWMAENLKTGTYKDGTEISTGLSNADWQTDASGAYTLYPYSDVSDISTDMDMQDAYGLLYNWYAVDNPSGLCPEGWRMPAHNDWNQLVDYLTGNYDEIDAGNTGIYLKSCRQPDSPLGGNCDTYDQPYWEPDNIYYGTDNFGFAALPGGYRSPEGDYYDMGGYGYWWSSTEYQGSYAFAHTMACDAGEVNVATDDKEYGYSVRCIKDK
ncbi:MAG: FISUMP domain-containing protein [Bacteroidales bacterium]